MKKAIIITGPGADALTELIIKNMDGKVINMHEITRLNRFVVGTMATLSNVSVIIIDFCILESEVKNVYKKLSRFKTPVIFQFKDQIKRLDGFQIFNLK